MIGIAALASAILGVTGIAAVAFACRRLIRPYLPPPRSLLQRRLVRAVPGLRGQQAVERFAQALQAGESRAATAWSNATPWLASGAALIGCAFVVRALA